ncbi:MAG: hypothetical protein COV10_03145 [Candidatus Vogelbacteria bacterium CG10_big_fil_rev_8_21_14_0_10_51_16]|uniref:D-alanine--D-alanine ligase n=1 Tax=Candidatus Vogelbacteria bacterium CG10_big_fil_rev_8_21_14_0_10_51_16 TaxID=1975045 RepID=A0A2H0RDY2_9BACT|nr:MAG: hypothetical protein COV10_03145 [Candidatus Vogelbacteria bacterium CG10_big_fil_rev_8_21_14_0_10_51_16]
MHKTRVAVVRGGPSNEYEVSLKTGAAVLKNLPEKYHGEDILVSKAGEWHCRGEVVAPHWVARHFDVAWNAMHGSYGEDGKVQHLLESLHMPFTGSHAYPSAAAMNKLVAKDYFRQHGIRTPYAVYIEESRDADFIADEVFKQVAPPWVIKPVSSGSSVGMSIARNRAELIHGIHHAFEHDHAVFVEQYLRGREATCGVVDSFRGKEHYALLPIEIIPPKRKVPPVQGPPSLDGHYQPLQSPLSFFDYKSKYDGSTQEICPGKFTSAEKRQIEELATKIHQALGLRHYSRSDFIVTPRGIYALEVNTLPGLTEESLLPKAIRAVGSSYPEFLDHILMLALNER